MASSVAMVRWKCRARSRQWRTGNKEEGLKLTAIATSLDAAVFVLAILAFHACDDQTCQVAVQLFLQCILLDAFCTCAMRLSVFDLLDCRPRYFVACCIRFSRGFEFGGQSLALVLRLCETRRGGFVLFFQFFVLCCQGCNLRLEFCRFGDGC